MRGTLVKNSLTIVLILLPLSFACPPGFSGCHDMFDLLGDPVTQETMDCVMGPEGESVCCDEQNSCCYSDSSGLIKCCDSSGNCCYPDGQSCSTEGDCCSGYCVNSVCSATPACKGEGYSCSADSQCCSGFCNAGLCSVMQAPCRVTGEGCSTPSQCCSGYCKNYLCSSPLQCRNLGQSCGYTSECCEGACIGYVCKTPPNCKENDVDCIVNSECCSQRCKQGACSDYVEVVSVRIEGKNTYNVGEEASLRAFIVYEDNTEEEIPVKWEIDSDVGVIQEDETETKFVAQKGGLGIVKSIYTEERKTLTGILPITVKAEVNSIAILFNQDTLAPGERIHFVLRGMILMGRWLRYQRSI